MNYAFIVTRLVSLGLIIFLTSFVAFSQNNDRYTVLSDKSTESLAIRENSISFNGDIVKFEIINVLDKAVTNDLPGLGKVTSNAFVVELECNCKSWEFRIIRAGILSSSDMSVRYGEPLNEKWRKPSWDSYGPYACSESRSTRTRTSFPDAASFLKAAPGLRKAAKERADLAALNDKPEDGALDPLDLDPSACKSAASRRQAALRFSDSMITDSSKMTPAMLSEAKFQHVNWICSTNIFVAGGDPFKEPEMIPTRYWYAFENKECQSDWNEKCLATVIFSVQEGFQICNKIFENSMRGRETSLTFTPSDWIPDDPSKTKFRALEMKMFSSGGGAVLDRTSANVKVSNVWITYVSDKLDAAERKRRGCEVLTREAPSPVPTPTPQTDLPYAQNHFSFPATPKRENFRVIMTTPVGMRNQTHLIIEYFDPHVWKAWKVDSEPRVIMGPGDIQDYAPIRFGATCWRIKSEYMTENGWRVGTTYSQPCN
jgi:hypothetical protein